MNSVSAKIKNITWLDERLIMCLVIIVINIFYLIKIPVGMVPDEATHFLRSFEISEGHMLSDQDKVTKCGGNAFPDGILQFASKDTELDYTHRTWHRFGNTSLYCPTSYIPQAIGIAISTRFTHNAYNICVAARVSSLIVCLIICCAAICIMPSWGRRIIFVISVFPMNMQERMCLAPDGLALALSLLIVALVMQMIFSETRIKKCEILLLAITCLALSLCKIVYIILILMIFMIPDDKFESKNQKFITKYAIPVVCIIANLIWLRIASGYLMEFNPGVNSKQQVLYVLSNIPGYIIVILRTFKQSLYGLTWINTMTGSALGVYNLPISGYIWVTMLVILILEMIITRIDKDIKFKYIIFSFLTFLGGFGLIVSSLYVQWTPVASPVIIGIQGRYFSPLIAPFILTISFIINLLRNKKDFSDNSSLSKKSSIKSTLSTISTKYGYILVVMVTVVLHVKIMFELSRFYGL